MKHTDPGTSRLVKLTEAVGQQIKAQIAAGGTVSTLSGLIIVSIPHPDFEHYLGEVLRLIYRSVEQQFPIRRNTRNDHRRRGGSAAIRKKKIPEMMRGLGKGIKDFKAAQRAEDAGRTDVKEKTAAEI